jgi:hypothetical protein
MQPFKVTLDEAKKFSQVWNYKGLAMPLDEVHCEFAKDFANIVLRSFVEQMMANAKAAKEKAAEAAKPLVSLG